MSVDLAISMEYPQVMLGMCYFVMPFVIMHYIAVQA